MFLFCLEKSRFSTSEADFCKLELFLKQIFVNQFFLVDQIFCTAYFSKAKSIVNAEIRPTILHCCFTCSLQRSKELFYMFKVYIALFLNRISAKQIFSKSEALLNQKKQSEVQRNQRRSEIDQRKLEI